MDSGSRAFLWTKSDLLNEQLPSEFWQSMNSSNNRLDFIVGDIICEIQEQTGGLMVKTHTTELLYHCSL